MIEKLVGDFPKIGIRPTIDGRQNGIRESLEDQTMDMAKGVQKFLEENMKYPNGKKVGVVIADTTIGGVAQAALCEDKFRKENVQVTITVTPCWCYGSETMDMNPFTQKAVWGFNGTERPGAVYLNAVHAAHDALGLPAFSIYSNDVQEADDKSIPCDVKKKLLIFAKAGMAVAMMRGKSYLSLGNVSMGIIGSLVSQPFFQKYLGMRNEYVDLSEVKRRLELDIFDPEEYKKALSWSDKHINIGDFDSNQEKVADEDQRSWLETSIKMTLISRDLMVGNPKLKELGYLEEALGHNAILAGFQGQRHWTDFMVNGDFLEAVLNTSYDWNGQREPYIMATENDSFNGVSMLFSHLLTNTGQIFADIRTYWSPDAIEKNTGWKADGLAKNGIIHLLNSGSASLDGTGEHKDENGKPTIKPWYDTSKAEADAMYENTTWHNATLEYFRGGGLSSRFKTKGKIPMTMTRVCLTDINGPYIQIIEGYSVELPEKVHDVLDRRTDPTWPTTWFAPKEVKGMEHMSPYYVMNNWAANHCAVSPGHIGEELIALAAMLRIPVAMHNIEDSRIFRPKTWMNFGTKNLEGADYRACKNFGPLYGKWN